MNRRLVMVLVFAAIVGLIASFFVYQVVLQMARAAGPQGTEPVVVAAVNMTMAEAVTSQHVKLVQWPKGAIPAGAIRTVAEAEGRVVRSAIVAGEPLLESRLAPELAGRGGVMAMLVPEGQRGVSIKVGKTGKTEAKRRLPDVAAVRRFVREELLAEAGLLSQSA